MPATTFDRSSSATWSAAPARSLAIPGVRAGLVVAALVIVALVFRTAALSTYGFSEDEINKLHAIDAYRVGAFSANAEHPMLMKLAMWGSTAAVERWNRIASPDLTVSAEAALRLPNAIAGAATTAALYGVADVFFGTPVAMATATFWAFDVNAIGTNRIGKEDTFLLFFFLVAVWCYERAKQIGGRDPVQAQRWYLASGGTFGLMLASKYMPQLLGIYALFNVLTDRDPGANKPNPLRYYGAMAAAFVIANPAVLLPATWSYIGRYVQGGMLVHHGYAYAGQLYVTNVLVSPLGVPPTFYLRLLATKVPLAVLALLVPGAIEIVRRRGERGFQFLRLFALLLLIPYSLMAAKFLRYALPMFAVVDLIAAVGLVSGIGWLLRKSWLSATTRVSVATAAMLVFGSGLVIAQQAAAPFYARFQNGIGERVDPGNAAFPEDSYDYGVREAAEAIAVAAPAGARVLTDADSVAAEYLRRTRPDVSVRSLSADGGTPSATETFVIVQEEHRSFENALLVDGLRAANAPWFTVRMGEAVAAEVFTLAGRAR